MAHTNLANQNFEHIILPPLPTRSNSQSSSFPLTAGSNATEEETARQSTPGVGLPFYSSTCVGHSNPFGKPPKRFRSYEISRGWRVVLLGSWMNLLLILIPISWVLSLTIPLEHGVVFIFCILAIIPLVKLHDLVTRDIAIRIGGSKTGMLNASMSNIIEIIVAICALRKCELRVVQSSLVGSMLSKLLLVLGLCFFAGGTRFTEQDFDATATQIHSSLLSISVGAVLLPAAYHFALGDDSFVRLETQKKNILQMSHAVSIVLLLIYAAYLLFQFWSHTHLYKDLTKKSDRLSPRLPESPRLFKLRATKKHLDGSTGSPGGSSLKIDGEWDSTSSFSKSPETSPQRFTYGNYPSETSLAQSDTTRISPNEKGYMITQPTVRLVGTDSAQEAPQTSSGFSLLGRVSNFRTNFIGKEAAQQTKRVRIQSPDLTPPGSSTIKKELEPQLSWPLSIFLMIILTVAVAITADWLVESMDGISTTISKEWVGLILLPAISSIADCITAVNVSVHDQLTFSVSVAVGSTIQTALFVIPFMVTLGWVSGKPLSLLMDPFESLVLYISVQTMSYVVADGKSNWLEGMILICLYVIIAVSFWFYPGSNFQNTLGTCSLS